MCIIYEHAIILEMLLAVVELQELPLLKLHVHEKSCSEAAAAAAALGVRHRVPDCPICCCVFLHLISVVLFIYSTTIYVNVPLGSAVACTASICL